MTYRTLREMYQGKLGGFSKDTIKPGEEASFFRELEHLMVAAKFETQRSVGKVTTYFESDGMFRFWIERHGPKTVELVGGGTMTAKSVSNGYEFPSLILDLPNPIAACRYWGMRKGLRDAQNESAIHAAGLKAANFQEFRLMMQLEEFKGTLNSEANDALLKIDAFMNGVK